MIFKRGRPEKPLPEEAVPTFREMVTRKKGEAERFPPGWKDHTIQLEKLIAQAKSWLETVVAARGTWAGGIPSDERRWVDTAPSHSYNQSKFMVMISVLEGSPPMGYVVVDYFRGRVEAFVGGFFPSRTLYCRCGHCGYKVEERNWEWRDKP